MMFMDTDAAQCERKKGDGGKENRHRTKDIVGELGPFECVPHPDRIGVFGIEVVPIGKHLSNLMQSGDVHISRKLVALRYC